MKITPATLIGSSALLLMLGTGCLAAAPPESLDINLQKSYPALAATDKDKKEVPGFSHAKHAEVFLKDNSTYSNTPYNDAFTCGACHPGVTTEEEIGTDQADAQKIAAIKKAGGVKKYMHDLCLDCHRAMKKAAVTTGPTSCRDCHNPQ